MSRIGIFGGSFDPVHLGHLCLAEDALEMASLDKVIFVPARLQPFKLNKRHISGRHRLAMLKLALEDHDRFEISTIELDEKRISYTYLTLKELERDIAPDDKMYFITGTDAFIMLDTWYKGDDILSEYGLIVGTRPGYREDEAKIKEDEFRRKFGTEIIAIRNRKLDISSTEIRKRIFEHKDTSDMLPEKVREYIDEQNIYEHNIY